MEILPAASSNETTVGPATGLIARYVQAGIEGADNTQRAYKSDLRRFTAWCQPRGYAVRPAPVEALVGYVAELANQGRKVATLQRLCAAVAKHHALVGLESPTDDKQFKIFMDGVRRVHGVAQHQAPAFGLEEFKRVIRSLDVGSPAGCRNRALLLLGFAGAFRRSELVSLNVEDLRFTEAGLVVTLRRSKTNQYGQHEEKAVFYSPEPVLCPIRNIQAWLAQLGGRAEGPLFVRVKLKGEVTTQRLSDQMVNVLVRRYLKGGYTAHSLRASFVTVAKLRGADDSEVMRQTKHKTPDMIRRYTRLEDVQQLNAAQNLGL